MADTGMADDDRLTVERIRALAGEYRHRAALHASLGHADEESNCRALAEIHDERARTLERRATAPRRGPPSYPA
jgi:hypothetical protein